MKIVVHIGMHKTGTTTFQGLLRKIQDPALRAYYPGTLNFTSNSSEFETRWVAKKIREAEAVGLRTLIFSHEELSLVRPEQLSVFLEGGEKHDVVCIVTFRHWCSYLPSRWSQNSKRRDSQSFFSFMDRLDAETPERAWIDFSRVLKTAEQAGFTQIRTISYDSSIAGEGIIPKLLTACGLQNHITESDGAPSNTSPRAESVEVYRLFNGVRSERQGRPQNALQDRLETGGRGLPCFDQARLVDRVLARKRGLADALHEIVDGKMERITLAPSMFQNLEERLSLSSADHAHEPLFMGVKPVSRVFSRADLSDLPVSLKQEMWSGLRYELISDRVRSVFRPGRR